MNENGMARKMVPLAGAIGAAVAVREVIGRSREADLRGEVALVTGASRGLGLALARELAAQGCRLVICARDEAELERAREDLEGQGAEVLAVPCDVGDKDDVDRMVAQVRERFGRIDLLVCNAGVIQVGQVRSSELEDYRQAMDIMYWGVLYPILAVLPEMRERQAGRIAIISSIGGKISVPRLVPYNASKFAAVGLAEGLRAELADEGITVTNIVPGLMRTGSFLNAYFSGDEEGRTAQYKLFAPMSSLPLLTVSAESAARTYVRAIRRGQAEIIYPPQYALVARLHGIAPATVARLLGVADRLIAPSGGGETTERGMAIDERVESRPWRWLTALGRRGAERLYQQPGPTDVPEPD
ncbi:MAG TPA: SDR family NAD(P)-dependent oxidoreductase [Thermomicrobiales bacterium]|nr:SDR family NAD(P)-dependent oxidoreductase [Thermomicrobiales bacterium]